MSRHPPSTPRLFSVVRASQLARLQQESLARAYELALPILRQRLAPLHGAKKTVPVRARRCASAS